MTVELQAADRWRAIDELIRHLVTTGKIKPEFRDCISDVVKKRESAMSTGIGFGIELPHACTNSVSHVVSIVGRSKRGIEFAALDQKPVHLVALFLVPSGEFQKHVNALANIAKQLHRKEFREELFQVSDDASVTRLLYVRTKHFRHQTCMNALKTLGIVKLQCRFNYARTYRIRCERKFPVICCHVAP